MCKEDVNSSKEQERNKATWQRTCIELGVSYLSSSGLQEKLKKYEHKFIKCKAGCMQANDFPLINMQKLCTFHARTFNSLKSSWYWEKISGQNKKPKYCFVYHTFTFCIILILVLLIITERSSILLHSKKCQNF